MTPDSILAKTAKGIEEIDKRTYHLSGRLRQALIRADGVKSLAEHLDAAGDLGEALVAQFDELQRGGFLIDTTPVEEVATEPLPPPAPAPRPKPVAAAAKPSENFTPGAASSALAFNSPVKFRLVDLLVDAIGGDTGKIGAALNNDCHSREDLSRWVVWAYPHIQDKAGKDKAIIFYKAAKKLVG